MSSERDLDVACETMSRFAERTGLADAGTRPRRYLWTDAFAVCNFLELHRRTGDEGHLRLALALVDQVHGTLGRHRADDPREGWISGLDEDEGRAHPTRGGLRIGKELAERGPDQPFDERLEWDRDGQYFHYLTKWMHALSRAGHATGEARYLRWALELAQAAHAGFTYVPATGGRPRMVWKASIDLARPLVPSMGHHDPLDGLLTFLELRAHASRAQPPRGLPLLDEELAAMATMCSGVDWTTMDTLGLGGVLSDAWRLAQLVDRGDCEEVGLLDDLLRSGGRGLDGLVRSRLLGGSAAERLAFRELGLAIGLHAVERLEELLEEEPPRAGQTLVLASRLERLLGFVPFAEEIERFWLEPANRDSPSWIGHLDINSVMLATSLVPDGYLAA